MGERREEGGRREEGEWGGVQGRRRREGMGEGRRCKFFF